MGLGTRSLKSRVLLTGCFRGTMAKTGMAQYHGWPPVLLEPHVNTSPPTWHHSGSERRVLIILLLIRVNSWLSTSGWKRGSKTIQNGRHSEYFSLLSVNRTWLLASLLRVGIICWPVFWIPPFLHSLLPQPGLAPVRGEGLTKKWLPFLATLHLQDPLATTGFGSNSRLSSWWISVELEMCWGWDGARCSAEEHCSLQWRPLHCWR